MSSPALKVSDLRIRLDTGPTPVPVVRGVSFDLQEEETLALVGESGSGKTLTALGIMGLLPKPPARIEGGSVAFGGRDLLSLSPRDWQAVRGREIGMVFQDPMAALNPVLTVGFQVSEGLRRHLGAGRREANERAEELMTLVGFPRPRDQRRAYPHQLSGGERQRAVLAMALACGPSLLIADEPTTALDVTVQAEIVRLVKRRQAETGMAVLWITHDLSLVAGLADRIAVMYAGAIVEAAPVRDLYSDPRHPYTAGLLRSLPLRFGTKGKRLPSIEGQPPDPGSLEPGCSFAPRCPHVEPVCRDAEPGLIPSGPGRSTACRRWEELGGAEKGGP